MKKIKTNFKGLYVIKSKKYSDTRGYLREISDKNIVKSEIKFNFYSVSKKNVLRGLHFQRKNQQTKLITVTQGKILDICLDLRKNSKTFGKIFKIILSEDNCKSLLIPKGFAHGFCGLGQKNVLLYMNSDIRNPEEEYGIAWNDMNLKIKWPLKKMIISKKDKNNLSFLDFKKKIKYL